MAATVGGAGGAGRVLLMREPPLQEAQTADAVPNRTADQPCRRAAPPPLKSGTRRAGRAIRRDRSLLGTVSLHRRLVRALQGPSRDPRLWRRTGVVPLLQDGEEHRLDPAPLRPCAPVAVPFAMYALQQGWNGTGLRALLWPGCS